MNQQLMPILDQKKLKESRYLCGQSETPADFLLAFEIQTMLLCLKREIDAQEHPDLKKWYDRILNTIMNESMLGAHQVTLMYEQRINHIRDDAKAGIMKYS